MKKFVIKTAMFAVIIICIVTMIFKITINFEYHIMKVPENVNKLFLGNSTIETSVDDRIVPNSINLAVSSEHIEFCYAKLKIMKKVNPQIDTVFMGVEDIIFYKDKDDVWSHLNHPFFVSEFSIEDIITNLKYRDIKWNTGYLKNLFITVELFNIARLGANPRNISRGGYLYLERDKLQKNIDLIAENPRQLKNPDTISPQILYFMNRIINYCHENGIELILMSSPKHKEAWRERSYLVLHKRYFPQLKLYDFCEIEYPDSCYGDVFHLNHRGAKVFSNQLALGLDSVHSIIIH